MIHSFFSKNLVTEISLEKNKTLNIFCLFLADEKNILQIFKIENLNKTSIQSFEKIQIFEQPIGIKSHNLMK